MVTLASSTLALTTAVAAYLYALCVTDPNPNPDQQKRAKTDRIGFFTRSWPVLARRLFTTIALYHALLALYFPSLIAADNAPGKPRMCPRPWNLSEDLFTWSPVTAASLLSVIVGGAVRLSAIGRLGKSFSFQLAAPESLVTTGIYRYIQHPSYIGLVLVYPLLLLILRSDAAMACFLEDGMLQRVRGEVAAALLSLSGIMVMAVRVRDEEAMLKEKFGDEWVEWNRTTKRLIPGVF